MTKEDLEKMGYVEVSPGKYSKNLIRLTTEPTPINPFVNSFFETHVVDINNVKRKGIKDIIKPSKLTPTQQSYINEFEQFLKNNNYQIEKEIVFTKLFDCKRKFRADYVITRNSYRAIIEVNGGQFTGGRHNRGGQGYENDLMKSNISSYNSTPYFQFTYQMLKRKEYEQFL